MRQATTATRRRWLLPTAAALVVLVAGTPAILGSGEPRQAATGTPELVARVVDESGRPLPRAEIRVGTADPVRTDDDGRLRAPMPDGPQLVSAVAKGHLPRTQAVAPDSPTEIRLTSDPRKTVSLRFGGDVMFGRRFYDANGDGDPSDGLLRPGASAADHAALLAPVRPLLEDADVTVVNFEAAVTDQPWVDTTGPRPPELHPTKDVVVTTAQASAEALAESGVDVVSLANNHVYDALGPGLDRTLASLDAAGLRRFGAGRTVDEAWAPAVVERRGQQVAFLGCTTQDGSEHAIPYVAGEGQGGAARCSTERLEREIRNARAQADVVVVMIHGGVEYDPVQSERVRELSAAAAGAGAGVVVDGHPHVVGGVTLADGTLVAESMGNLLFDQRIWPTFLSYLLRVDVRAGRAVAATVDPLFSEDHIPRPTVGVLADAAARRAAGLTTGSEAPVQPPGMGATVGGPPATDRVEHTSPSGTVARLAPGWWVEDPGTGPPPAPIRVGEDLLWTGSFEDMDTDPDTPGAHGWALPPTADVTPAAACSGEVGVQLRRSPASTRDVVATPAHRQLVTPGTELSLVAEFRDASPGATLELRWYAGSSGKSESVTRVPIPAGSSSGESCRQVRIDTTVPDGMVAVQPMLRLRPTGDVHLAAHLAVDDVLLVAWAAPGEHGRRFSVIDVRAETAVPLAHDAQAASEPVIRVRRSG